MGDSRNCVVAGCENEYSPRSFYDICETCRAAISRWAKRRPAEVVERKRKLRMYADRFNTTGAFKAQQKERAK